MPLTLTLTEGALPAGEEKIAFSRLCEATLRWHGMADNETMRDNIVGSVNVLPAEATYAGMAPSPVVFVEWKVPSFAFADRRVQLGYFAEATEIVHALSQGRQPKDRIFINVVHAVDGAWNFNGRAMTNAEIGQAVAKAERT